MQNFKRAENFFFTKQREMGITKSCDHPRQLMSTHNQP